MPRFNVRFLLRLASIGLVLALARAEPVPVAKPYGKGVVVTPLLKTTVTANGQPLVAPPTDRPEVTAVLVEIPPGQQTGWHQHPVPCYAYIASGAISVELADGTVHEYKEGQAIAEVVKVLHNGTNRGTVPVKIVMFALGTEGAPFGQPAPAPR